MQTRKIGSLDVSLVGLGANNFGWFLDEERSANVLHAALDAGVTFIDTADVYGATKSEEFIGKNLKGHRDEVILATKFGNKIDDDHLGGGKPEYVHSAVDDSLRRLQTDHIDLYILHRPDPDTPINDTLEALDAIVKAGKVREIGCSNFSIEQLEEAEAAAASGAAKFVNLQNQYNILQRKVERDVLPECAKNGIAFVPYSPLANGFLTGKYRRDSAAPEVSRLGRAAEERRAAALSPENFDRLEALAKFCEERDHNLLDLAISWLLAQQAVASVIAGATTPDQVSSNVAAGTWQLSKDDLETVNELVPLR